MPIAAAMPETEEKRLQALCALHILDTPAEAVFDDLAAMAADLCGAPIALVSLVDAERQWFKARIGLDVPETHRNLAFCAHAILQSEVMVVPDATKDPRFADSPLVLGPPFIRSYAGAPITSPDGSPIGTLCVIHQEPTQLSARQIEHLRTLARVVTDALALREARLRAEEASQAKTRLLANISHELRTPLNAIFGYGELLQEGVRASVLEQSARSALLGDLERLLLAARRQAALVQDLLDCAGVGMPQCRVRREPVDVAHLLATLAEEVRPLFEAGNNRLETPPVRLQGPLLTDPARLSQCVSALLDNAAKFTRNGRVRLEAEDVAGTVRISVADNGVGIAPELQGHLFEPFAQAADARTPGAGLGLATCRRVIAALGGSIAVDSAPGRGSTFCLSLPRAIASAA